jgi:hypothetical protein
VLDRYKKGELDVVLKIGSARNSRVFDVIFNVVPVDSLGDLDVCSLGRSPKSASRSDANNKCDQGVFTGVSDLVEGVERVIPSFVAFESSKDRLDFRSQILASAPHAVFEIDGRIPERKGNISGIEVAAGGKMGGEGGMIETGPSVLDHFCSEDAPPEWKSFSEFDFVDFVSSIKVRLNEFSVWLFTEKNANLGFQCCQVFLCAREPAVSAVECGGVIKFHGQKDLRSDERPGIYAGAGEPIEDSPQASFGNEDRKASTEADAGSESQESKALDDSLPLVTTKSDRNAFVYLRMRIIALKSKNSTHLHQDS